MIKILHIITGLGSGGAENMLHKFVKYSDKDRYYHEVISLTDEGVMGKKIEAEGVKVHVLNLNYNNLLPSLFKAKKICESFDIINTWLYHADIFGFIVGKILSKKKIIWNVRHSNLDRDANKLSTLKVVKLNSMLSKYINCITYNSHQAYENHLKFGYYDKNSRIIPNGFELDRFKFNKTARIDLRNELSIKENEIVLITIGRWNIQKDYYTLLKALNELKDKNINFKMIMVGTNLDSLNKELNEIINDYELEEHIILLGRRSDIPQLLSASDLYVSSSLGESFSNAIGEAMACELYCVVTDVGDSKKIIGQTGTVVQPRNHIALSQALYDNFEVINKNKNSRNIRARKRIIENYEVNSIIKLIESGFDRVLDNLN